MHSGKCVYYVMYQHMSCGSTMSSKISGVKFMLVNIANEFLNLSLVGGDSMYVEDADKLGHGESDDNDGKNPGSNLSEAHSTVLFLLEC